MPKITNIKYVIAGKNYECSVWYTASDKFFLKGFPQEIERAAQITPLGNQTEDELYEKYTEGIAKYEEMISVSKKVILFRISAADPHVKKYSDWHEENQFPIGVGKAHGCKMGFTIDYDIKMMRTVGDSFYLHDFNEDGKLIGSGNEIKNERMYKIIDYTPEREMAFKELYTRFDKMLNAFINGFEKAEIFIDSIPTTKLLS